MTEPEKDMYSAFFEASRRFRRQGRGWYTIDGVTPAQLSVLWAIEHDRRHGHCPPNGQPPADQPPPPENDPIPGAKVSTLAAILGQAPPGISQRVNELEVLGYARREPSRTDRRVTYICLTDAGREVLAASHRKTADRQQRILDELGTRGTELLVRYMNQYADAAEKVAAAEINEKKEQATI